jgi:DNA-binding NarL/FixJ family response regulator
MVSDWIEAGQVPSAYVTSAKADVSGSSGRATQSQHLARLRALWPLAGRDTELQAIEAVLNEARNRAVYLFGAAGVGKTRLASELRARADAAGTATLRVVGNATTANVPFGAVAHLLLDQNVSDENSSGSGPLAQDGANEAAILVGMVERTVRETGGGRSIVFVDDAHLLDALSATALALIIAHGAARVVATVRLGAQLPDALLSALRSDEATRFDIKELSDYQMDELLLGALSGPVEKQTLQVFRSRALGNVLFLRELAIGAVESGALRLLDGFWRLEGVLEPSTRLLDLLGERLSVLAFPDRRALELLSVGGAIDLNVLEWVAPDADLAGLEERNILRVHIAQLSSATSSRYEVSFAHPLFAEAVLLRISKLRARSVRRDLADAIEAAGSNRADDTLRVAVLRLEAGGKIDHVALERGALLARYANDFVLTARLGREAFAIAPSSASGLVLGEALNELGHFDEAKLVLESSMALSTNDRELAAAGTQLLVTHFWGLHDDDACKNLAETLQSRLTDLESIGALIGSGASITAFSGKVSTALSYLDLLPPMLDPESFCKLAVIRSIVLSAVGRTEDGLAEAEQAYSLQLQFDRPSGISHISTHLANASLALHDAGRFVDSRDRALDGFAHAIADNVLITPVWCQLVAGECSISLGRAGEARQHFQRALMNAEKRRFRGAMCLAFAGLAMANALLGDVHAAEGALTLCDAESGRLEIFAPNVAIGRATVAVAQGALGSAVSILQAAAEIAAVGGLVGGEARLLHGLVRLGLAANVSQRLEALASVSDSKLVAAMSEHALSAAVDDQNRLAAVAEVFAAMGAVMVAAEVSAEASSSYLRRGEIGLATVASTRSGVLLGQCDTVMQANAFRLPTITPLSAREREVAYFAAEGASNKELADRLSLSTRTIENHMSSVFSKLGALNRLELKAVIAPSTR